MKSRFRFWLLRKLNAIHKPYYDELLEAYVSEVNESTQRHSTQCQGLGESRHARTLAGGCR